MSFASNTPITAASSSADYTHRYKKHFADRPTAFALSPRSELFSSTTVDSSTFASPHNDSQIGPGNVDLETHNALANLGWKIRSRVNQGYPRSATQVGTQSGFMTESDVLRNVTNSRGWSRTSTAPVGSNFDDLRNATEEVVEVQKRRRRSEIEAEEVEMNIDTEEGEARRIARLPKLSFSSSISSTSSLGDHFPRTATFSRSHSSAHPFQQDAGMHDTPMVKDQLPTDEPRYDFSMHFDRTDF